MERIHGETIGRRIVKSPPPGLDVQLAEELAKIHAIPPCAAAVPRDGRPGRRASTRSSTRSASRTRRSSSACTGSRTGCPTHREPVVVHGDWRIGNIAVDENGIVAVLDWEFAHLADPVEDLAWPLVRAWRFGADDKHLGGVGDLDRYLERYAELTGLEVTREELLVWEVFGNVKWATGCLTQSRRHFNGQERERRARRPRSARRRDGVRAAGPDRTCSMTGPTPAGAGGGRARVPAGGDPPDPRRPPAEVPDARRDQRARDRRARALGDDARRARRTGSWRAGSAPATSPRTRSRC